MQVGSWLHCLGLLRRPVSRDPGQVPPERRSYPSSSSWLNVVQRHRSYGTPQLLASLVLGHVLESPFAAASLLSSCLLSLWLGTESWKWNQVCLAVNEGPCPSHEKRETFRPCLQSHTVSDKCCYNHGDSFMQFTGSCADVLNIGHNFHDIAIPHENTDLHVLRSGLQEQRRKHGRIQKVTKLVPGVLRRVATRFHVCSRVLHSDSRQVFVSDVV